MKRLKSNQKGLVMLAVMFLVALLVPLIYIGTYFRLSNQQETFERSIQDRQLYWALVATINRTKFELQSAVAQYKLDGGQFPANARVNLLDTPMNNWLNGTHGFKDNFHSFLDDYSHAGSIAGQSIEFALDDCANRCFAYTRSNNGESALFTLEARVRLPAANMTGAIRQMRQSLYISTSNLADFAVFYYNNFDTSPGTDTIYQGPMYVSKKANFAPNQGTALKLTFKEGDENPYSLKAHEIEWFSSRDLGCDPHRPASDCTRDPITNEFESGYYERDVDGKPVLYYYNSNNQPGWADGSDSNSTLDSHEKSTILVKNNDDVNFDGQLNTENFTELVGLNRTAPVQRNYFNRGQPPIKLTDTTYIRTDYIQNSDTSVANTSLALNFSDATDNFPNPLQPFVNPRWSSYLSLNFSKNGKMLFSDNAESLTLQLGGAQNPHELIDLATDEELADLNHPQRRVKLHWLARNFNPNIYNALAINFERLYCNCSQYNDDASTCDTVRNFCLADNNQSEDPLFWHSSVLNDGFIAFDGISIPDYIYVPILTGSPDTSPDYRDERRSKDLHVITVDVAKLKSLIEHGSNLDEYGGTIFGQHGSNTREKPFLLYIGLNYLYQLNTVVRLINADQLPDNGLTIATNGFVQISGDYNTEEPQPGTVPEANHCEMKPAAILADQVMALSNSWLDWSGANAPDNYTDPSDNRHYPSPIDPQTNQTYSSTDYRSHPVRCTLPNGNSCADVNVNAMIVTGNIPNQLLPLDTYEEQQGHYHISQWNNVTYQYDYIRPNEPFYVAPLSWLWNDEPSWQNLPNRIYNWNQGSSVYINADSFKNENYTAVCVTQDYYNPANNPPWNSNPNNGVNVGTCIANLINNSSCSDSSYLAQVSQAVASCNINDPSYPQCIQDAAIKSSCIRSCAPDTSNCINQHYANTPVRVIDYYNNGDDLPHYKTLPASADTVGELFNSDRCPSCNGKIPTFLKVDEEGRFSYLDSPTPDIESNHIKDSELFERRLRPGVRFASVTEYGRYLPNDQTPLYLFPKTSYNLQSENCCHEDGSWCNKIRDQYSCVSNPEHCGIHCPNPNDPICDENPSSEVAQCPSGENQTCPYESSCYQPSCDYYGNYYCPTQDSSGNPCSPNFCNVPTPVTTFRPNPPQIVYTKGGAPRLYNSGYMGDYNKREKFKYYYVPNYVPLYSGGHENLIRYGENWNKSVCQCNGNNCNNCQENGKNEVSYLGTAHALWTAQTLVRSDEQPAYWTPTTYAAPEREFLYATSLRNDFCKPPGVPTSIIVRTEGQDQQ